MTYRAVVHANESQACLRLTQGERADLDERIRNALGYMAPGKIAQYLGVPLDHVEGIRAKTAYYRVKDLRHRVAARRVG